MGGSKLEVSIQDNYKGLENLISNFHENNAKQFAKKRITYQNMSEIIPITHLVSNLQKQLDLLIHLERT